MALDIGDEAVPVVNITQLGNTYLTEGEEGIVTNRQIITRNENNEDIYTYQVTFPVAIEGTTVSGSPADPLRLFWFSSEELGLETITLEPFDYAEVDNNLSQARAISQTATSVVQGIVQNSQPQNLFNDSLNQLESITTLNNTTLINSDFNNPDEEIREQEATAVNFNSQDLEVAQEVFQEIAENMAAIQDVQLEIQTEINTQAAQTDLQTRQYNIDRELDHSSYIEALKSLNSSLPVGSVYDLKETDWEEAFTPPLTINIVPEAE